MDKETLIKLATPASIFALALSIISFPLISKAEFGSYYDGTPLAPIHIKCVGGC